MKTIGEALHPSRGQARAHLRQFGIVLAFGALCVCSPAAAQTGESAPEAESASKETAAAHNASSDLTREELLTALELAQASAESAARASEETRAMVEQMREAQIERETDQDKDENQTAAQENQASSTEDEESQVLRKGAWYLGGTMSLSYGTKDNVSGLLEEVTDATNTGFRFQGIAGRLLISRMLALGAVLGYERQYSNGTYDSNGAEQARGSVSNAWTLGPSLRQFIRLGQSPVFLFYEADLVGGYKEESKRTTTIDASTVSVADTYSLALNVMPGVAVFATDFFAVELGVNVLGASLAWTDVTTDYGIKGSTFNADIDLNVDLLSLQFAFVGYF